MQRRGDLNVVGHGFVVTYDLVCLGAVHTQCRVLSDGIGVLLVIDCGYALSCCPHPALLGMQGVATEGAVSGLTDEVRADAITCSAVAHVIC